MAKIDTEMIKGLRARTNAGILDCKEALKETDGDMEKAVDFLRKKGLATALKRAGRETSEGVINSYIHAGGKIGVLVEVNCETDFVAKTDEFKELVKNLAMHIAATRPLGILSEDIPEEIVKREEEIYRAQALETGKPEKIIDKIVEGKMKKFYRESCLLEQQYVKDTDLTIQDLIHEMVSKMGESISVRRFARYQLGGE
ncbi:MAG: translation elongation factor Ts [Deltaproteobacteria bacterium]|jgi:elongation factor Ts|nr:translation elongation factor Ts [Deltaproteobacteria bacterium]